MTNPKSSRAIACGISAVLMGQCKPPVPEPAVQSGVADMCVLAEPLTRLRGPEGEPLFGVTRATILGDRIAIAESSARRLLVYSFGGEWLASLGRPGSGPGEFRSVGLVQAAGDRLMAFDWELRRITVFDQDGVVTRMINLSIPQPFAAGNVIGFLPDGRSIGLLWMFAVPVTGGQIVRRTAVLGLFDSTGAFTDSLTTVPGSERYAEPFGRAGERRTAVPLGKLTAAVVFGNTLAISDGTDWTIRLIDVDTRAESFYLPPGRFSPTDVTPAIPIRDPRTETRSKQGHKTVFGQSWGAQLPSTVRMVWLATSRPFSRC